MKIEHHLIDGRDLIVIDDAFSSADLSTISHVIHGITDAHWAEGHDENLLRYSGIHAMNVDAGTDSADSVIRGDCVFLENLPEHEFICGLVDSAIINAFSTVSIVSDDDKAKILEDKNEFFCRVLRYMPGYYDDCADGDNFLHTDIRLGVMFTPVINPEEPQSTLYYEDDKFETPVLTLDHKPGRLVVFDGRIVHAPSKCFKVPRYAMSLHNDNDMRHYLSKFR
ncbi:hypothetical protein VPHD480_0311 [Vibrio phage D480]|nr:hypothetical protein MYOV011v1_p0315 [Vibrio phage 6E35.1a]